MSSPTPWTVSDIEARSADLVAPVGARMRAWCDTPPAHARFLNTLSLLEHIGSRKIMVSQTRGPLGEGVLKHLAEETRHAFFFKRAAEKIAGRTMTYTDADTLAPSSARMYFARLDAAIGRDVGSHAHVEVPYLYVSLTIELRAIWAYRLYHEALVEQGVRLSLRSVLAEEELHLDQMGSHLAALGEDPNSRINGYAALEDELFRGFWAALESAAELPQAA